MDTRQRSVKLARKFKALVRAGPRSWLDQCEEGVWTAQRGR
jgi:hypothetical protein